LLWLIPVAIFLILQAPQVREVVKGKLYICAAGLNALGIFALLSVRNSVMNPVVIGMRMDWSANVSMNIGFFLPFGLYVVGGLVSVGCLMAMKKNS